MRQSHTSAAGTLRPHLVESLGAAPVPLVVEDARYRSLPGQTWAGGAAALATPVPYFDAESTEPPQAIS